MTEKELKIIGLEHHIEITTYRIGEFTERLVNFEEGTEGYQEVLEMIEEENGYLKKLAEELKDLK